MRRLLLLIAACSGSQIGAPKVQEPKLEVTKHLPATLEADHPKEGEPRPAHVRVWADAAVRATPHWKEDITEQLDYASQLLTPMLGVKLVVDEFKDWDRNGVPSAALAALVEADDGHDVTWVVGYVAPDDASTKVMSELGDAHVLGRHVTVRAWAEKPETDVLAAMLPDLKPAARAEVIAAHKRHKQTCVLLHQLAITLGTIAEADPAWIRHPLYSPKMSTMSGRNRELLQLAIDERLGGGNDQTMAHDLLEAIEKQDWGGWIPTDHDVVVAALRNVVDSAKAGKTAADVPTAAYEQFDRIREMVKRGEAKQALIELDNLLIAYPGNATMVEEKCEILLVKPGVADKQTRTTCARVAELAPGDPTVHFAVGEALVKTGDITGARAELEKAASKIANLKTGQGDAWRKLIGIYAAMGALTWTDDAIAASHLEHDPAVSAVAHTRATYGIPRGAKFVKPADEAALVAAVRGANDLIYANKFGEAEAQLAKAAKKWPGAPGLSAARCDLALRQGATDTARAACDKALAGDPDDSWALYLSGIIALKDTSAGGTKHGIELLKKAIAVDPDLQQPWHALAKAYDRAKDSAAREQLAKDYQAKFGSTLP
jgi:tetratricopeptide (TPR) repeat protein